MLLCVKIEIVVHYYCFIVFWLLWHSLLQWSFQGIIKIIAKEKHQKIFIIIFPPFCDALSLLLLFCPPDKQPFVRRHPGYRLVRRVEKAVHELLVDYWMQIRKNTRLCDLRQNSRPMPVLAGGTLVHALAERLLEALLQNSRGHSTQFDVKSVDES